MNKGGVDHHLFASIRRRYCDGRFGGSRPPHQNMAFEPHSSSLILRAPSVRHSTEVADGSIRLERNLVVDGLVEAFAAPARRTLGGAVGRGGVARLVVLVHAGLRASAGTRATRIEHGEHAVEALQHHLGGVAVLAVLALPFAGL